MESRDLYDVDDMEEPPLLQRRSRRTKKGGRFSSGANPAADDIFDTDLALAKRFSSSLSLSNSQLLDSLEMREALQLFSTNFADQVSDSQNKLRDLYSEWFSRLHLGFHLIFYGIGSKKDLLDDFAQSMFGANCITISGFSPFLEFRDVVSAIQLLLRDAVDSDFAHASVLQQASMLGSKVRGRRIYLVVHNLDVWMARNSSAWSFLEAFSKSSAVVHIVASVEESNAPMYLPQGVRSHIFVRAHTYRPYVSELMEERRSGTTGVSEAARVRGAITTLRGLTANGRDIYLHILEHALSSTGEQKTYSQLFEESRNNFWVNNDATFHKQMGEFTSHKILSIKKNSKGQDVVTIPFSAEGLQQIRKGLQPNQTDSDNDSSNG